MQALLRLERVLDHARGARQRGLDVTAPQVIVERDVGIGTALEMFQIGERAGGLSMSWTTMSGAIAATSS